MARLDGFHDPLWSPCVVAVVPSSGDESNQLDNLATAAILISAGGSVQKSSTSAPAAASASAAVKAISKPPSKLATSELGSRLFVCARRNERGGFDKCGADFSNLRNCFRFQCAKFDGEGRSLSRPDEFGGGDTFVG